MISAEACRDAAHLMGKLTQRERDIIVLAGKGLIDREIGSALGLSPHTVREYLKRAFQALDVRTRTEAAVIATKAGLV